MNIRNTIMPINEAAIYYYNQQILENKFVNLKVVRRNLLRAIRKKRPNIVDDLENVWFH